MRRWPAYVLQISSLSREPRVRVPLALRAGGRKTRGRRGNAVVTSRGGISGKSVLSPLSAVALLLSFFFHSPPPPPSLPFDATADTRYLLRPVSDRLTKLYGPASFMFPRS